jgi:hypothetical protein
MIRSDLTVLCYSILAHLFPNRLIKADFEMEPIFASAPQPTLQRANGLQFQLEGIIRQRLQACLDQWWLIAPDANPALLQMFRDRDRKPERELLPWSGEFAGKFLTSGVLGWQLTRDPQLYAVLRRTVDELIAVQDEDGYLGPFSAHQAADGTHGLGWGQARDRTVGCVGPLSLHLGAALVASRCGG